MADGKTRIDPGGALRENQRLREIAQRFHDAKARLADAASSHDGCWGSDEFGQAFAKSYVPSSQQTMKNVGVVEDSLAAVELPVHPLQEGAKPRFVRITPDALTGRRFVTAAPRDVLLGSTRHSAPE